jgi:hypothetical protein
LVERSNRNQARWDYEKLNCALTSHGLIPEDPPCAFNRIPSSSIVLLLDSTKSGEFHWKEYYEKNIA